MQRSDGPTGAVGIEMSAEMKVHFPQCEVILVHSRDTLLSTEPLTDEYKSIAYNLLTQQGVEVILGQRVVDELAEGDGKVIVLSGGDTIKCDKVIYTAQQQGANTTFVPSEVLDTKGCIPTQDTYVSIRFSKIEYADLRIDFNFQHLCHIHAVIMQLAMPLHGQVSRGQGRRISWANSLRQI